MPFAPVAHFFALAFASAARVGLVKTFRDQLVFYIVCNACANGMTNNAFEIVRHSSNVRNNVRSYNSEDWRTEIL